MVQLTLDIRPAAEPSLANFVAGANADLLFALGQLARGEGSGAVYLWGPPGSGRTHLLQATCAAAREAGRGAGYSQAREIGADPAAPPGGLFAADDVESLAEAGQHALFRLFNATASSATSLLLAGPVPPRQLALREDLRTRVGAALVFEVKPLTDEEKVRTLAAHARQRGMRLEPELIGYLLRHGRRDLRWLLAVLDALDQASLQQQRPLTLPLLREILQPPLR